MVILESENGTRFPNGLPIAPDENQQLIFAHSVVPASTVVTAPYATASTNSAGVVTSIIQETVYVSLSTTLLPCFWIFLQRVCDFLTMITDLPRGWYLHHCAWHHHHGDCGI